MASPTALFPAGSLVDSVGNGLMTTVPGGKTVANPTHMVTLILSTGESVQVGTVEMMMRLITAMRIQQIWHIQPTEDLIIMLADTEKLIICEATFPNQKLLNSCTPAYIQGQLAFLQRGTASVLSLDEALQSVGHYRMNRGACWSNFDLQQPTGSFSPRMIIVDYAFKSDASVSSDGTQTMDLPTLYFFRYWHYTLIDARRPAA
jgi:hypothetical protein